MSDFEQALIRAAEVRRAQLNEKPAELIAVEEKMHSLAGKLSDTGGYGDIGWSFDLTQDLAIMCRRNGATRAVWQHYSGDATALYPTVGRDALVISRSVDHAIELTANLVVGLLKP